MKKFLLFFSLVSFSAYNSWAGSDCEKYSSQIANDKEYRVGFGDSGVGGLIFALDVKKELENKLKNLESHYAVKFVFNHLGDNKNAPYGSKKPEEIRILTQNLLEYLAKIPNTNSLVLACNTASTVYDEKMRDHFREKYPALNIITMIEESSKAVVDETLKSKKSSNYVALMATPATIKSKAYQTKLSQSFADKNSEIKIYDYSPQTWVKNIESGAPQNVANADILKDLEIFQQQIGTDFSKVSVVGLFCTHYPLYKDKIQDFFRKNGNKNAVFLAQGAIFSDKIYADITTNLKKLEYKTRKKSVPTKCVSDVTVDSEVTGSVEQTKDVISKIHPQYLDKINFKQISLK